MALASQPSPVSFHPPNLLSLPSFRRSQELHLPRSAKPNLVRGIVACSVKKSSIRGRAAKSNEELRNELREFISAVGLPENCAPSLKELSENGRKDLAKIVRRRGYKAITELLLNSTGENCPARTLEGNQDIRNANLYEIAVGQERNINASPDCTSSSRNNSLEKGIVSTENHVQVFEDLQEFLKAAKFIKTGQMDTTEGEDSKLDEDLTSEAHEMKHLTSLLDQKVVEFSQLKQQIEDEKIALSNLHAKYTTEFGHMKEVLTETEVELHAVEKTLNGLKGVLIDFMVDGQSVEVAGSFDGWKHRIRMDLHPSSRFSKVKLWTTMLWLYPGVYEIKFIVDGRWKVDHQRKIKFNGSIMNNELTVDP